MAFAIPVFVGRGVGHEAAVQGARPASALRESKKGAFVARRNAFEGASQASRFDRARRFEARAAQRWGCRVVMMSAKTTFGEVEFVKMHGIGNDYVYIDATKSEPGMDVEKQMAIVMSNRNKGIGGDGVIFIKKATKPGAKYRMQMHNADGSISEMCGNGLRCVAKFLFDRRMETDLVFPIETGAGILTVTVTPEAGDATKAAAIRVKMGEPILERARIPMSVGDGEDASARMVDQPLVIDGVEYRYTAVSMGNPHCIIFVDDAANFPVTTVGPKIENHALFPNRVNVEFVQVVSPTKLIQRTWERGSGETLACGTGASAVCVAGVLTGRTERSVGITLLGGDLELEWDEGDNCVYKTGPAAEVFAGTWRD
eukprot:tig00021721_g23203.t1